VEEGNRKNVVEMDMVEEKDLHRHRLRDRSKLPIDPPDERILAFQLKRPDIPLFGSWEEVMADARIDVKIRERMDNLAPSLRTKFLDCLAHRNCNMVETMPVVNAALGCNVCAYPLGCMEQAKAVVYYLIDYIVKDPLELQAAVALIEKARKRAIQYPSTADDKGTPVREGMYRLTKTINLMTGSKELPGVLASMLCFGRSRYMSNHGYVYINVMGL